MMSFVPALIYNVLHPLKIGSAERCDVAAEIDDLGEARQLRQLLTREELEIKIVKQPVAWTRFAFGYQNSATIATVAHGALDYLVFVQ